MAVAADTILVIDDNTDLLEGLRLLLSQQGYAVETATNGRDALMQLYNGFRPCVIVLDLMMPVMNGFEFRQQQLTDPRLAEIPIIAYSAFADPSRTARQLRAAAYVYKPTDVEMLAARVRERVPEERRGLAGPALTIAHSRSARVAV